MHVIVLKWYLLEINRIRRKGKFNNYYFLMDYKKIKIINIQKRNIVLGGFLIRKKAGVIIL
jgi:hypothetical protein